MMRRALDIGAFTLLLSSLVFFHGGAVHLTEFAPLEGTLEALMGIALVRAGAALGRIAESGAEEKA